MKPNFPPGAAEGAVDIAVNEPSSFESWDPYHPGAERGERLVAGFPLPDSAPGVSAVELDSPAPLTAFEWVVEKRRVGPPIVWVWLSARATGEFGKHVLWRENATYRIRVVLTDSAAAAKWSGGGVRSR